MTILYSKKYNYILKYHPKSGCSTIRIMFLNCHRLELPLKKRKCNHHKIGCLFRRKPDCKPIFSLNLVRNPYSRLVSTFTNKVCNNTVKQQINLPKNTFYEFIKFILKLHRKKKKLQRVNIHFVRQDDDFSEDDIIIKLESLSNDIIEAYSHPQTKNLLPIIKRSLKQKVNSSNKNENFTEFVGMKEYPISYKGPWSNFKYFYNDEIKAMVDEIYDNEFKIFGYPKVL